MTIWRRSARLVALSAVLVLSACTTPRGQGGDTRELPTASDMTQQQKRATIRLQLAVSYYQQRQWEVALDEVKLALQANPDYSDAYGVRGLIYMEMGENARADENFQQAMRLAPNNPDLANNYGWFLCKSGRTEEGLKNLEAALKMRNYASPDKALNNAGLCSMQAQQLTRAEEYFRQAFKLEPNNPLTNSNLAKLYFQKREYDRAQFYLSRVMKAAQDQELPADVLWLGIRLQRKLGDGTAERALSSQLRRSYPDSAEYKALQRGAFDE